MIDPTSASRIVDRIKRIEFPRKSIRQRVVAGCIRGPYTIAAEFLEIGIVSRFPLRRYTDSRRQSRYTQLSIRTRRKTDVERAFLIQCRVRINWN